MFYVHHRYRYLGVPSLCGVESRKVLVAQKLSLFLTPYIFLYIRGPVREGDNSQKGTMMEGFGTLWNRGRNIVECPSATGMCPGMKMPSGLCHLFLLSFSHLSEEQFFHSSENLLNKVSNYLQGVQETRVQTLS